MYEGSQFQKEMLNFNGVLTREILPSADKSIKNLIEAAFVVNHPGNVDHSFLIVEGEQEAGPSSSSPTWSYLQHLGVLQPSRQQLVSTGVHRHVPCPRVKLLTKVGTDAGFAHNVTTEGVGSITAFIV